MRISIPVRKILERKAKKANEIRFENFHFFSDEKENSFTHAVFFREPGESYKTPQKASQRNSGCRNHNKGKGKENLSGLIATY